jgi:hypothetical protein
MTSNADILRLKKELQILKAEQPKDFEEMMVEVNEMKTENKFEALDKSIAEIFEEYDETFRALA